MDCRNDPSGVLPSKVYLILTPCTGCGSDFTIHLVSFEFNIPGVITPVNVQRYQTTSLDYGVSYHKYDLMDAKFFAHPSIDNELYLVYAVAINNQLDMNFGSFE